MRIAVIGAGLSGLAGAGELVRAGHDVTVFEKSRGVGGRLATRRLDDGLIVNHGAPAVDVPAGSALAAAVGPVEARRVEVVGDDPGGLQLREAVLPTAGVTAVAKHWAEGLEIQRPVRIARLRPVDGGYELGDEQGNGHGRFDRVVISAPAPQAADLLATVAGEQERVRRLRGVLYDPAVMVIGVASRAATGPRVMVLDGPVLRVALVPHPTAARASVVAHLSTPLSERLLDEASDAELLGAVGDVPALTAAIGAPATWTTVKRWRFATVRPGLADAGLAVPARGIAISGDAVAGSGMDPVWRSGLDAARRVVEARP